jgi:hypothetical protein
MIVTLLWEDERGGVAKGFGPHELLLSCLVDDLGLPRELLLQRVNSLPKKGRDNLRTALQHEFRRLARYGPVLAVIDKDKARDLWKGRAQPPSPPCMSGMVARLHEDAPGDYDVVFLEENMETLVDVVCKANGQPLPSIKPRPDRRDQLLMPAAWASASVRHAIRSGCPSFDRLVSRVGRHLRP